VVDLLALTFLACLAQATGERCERVSIPWDRSPMQCMLLGQSEMARWFEEHPGWRPRGGWRCERERET